jgi:hypothetical protein
MIVVRFVSLPNRRVITIVGNTSRSLKVLLKVTYIVALEAPKVGYRPGVQ